jgi:hypothetical protein
LNGNKGRCLLPINRYGKDFGSSKEEIILWIHNKMGSDDLYQQFLDNDKDIRYDKFEWEFQYIIGNN